MFGGPQRGIVTTVRVPEPAVVTPEGDERAIFELLVNEVPKGEAVLLIKKDSVWIEQQALDRLELRGLDGAGKRTTVGGETYVDLSSLGPKLRFALNDASFQLRLDGAPELLGKSRVDLGTRGPAGLEFRRNASALINYGMNWHGPGLYDLSAEAGMNLGNALLLTTVSRTNDRAVLRGLSSLSFDDRRRLTRWVVGDAIASGGNLGGGVALGGISVSREFDIDPYFIRYPTVGLSGMLETPSTVDVYVNDRLVRREHLPPGQFELANLPVSVGRGVARLVVRDAFGREHETASPYSLTNSVLAPGLHEYRYQFGFVRTVNRNANWDYGAPVLFARHRVGLTEVLTGGVLLQASRDLLNLGPLVTARLPIGELDLAGGLSRYYGATGLAASAAYSVIDGPVSFGASIRAMNPAYTALGFASLIDRARFEAEVSGGFHVGRAVNFNARYASTDRLSGDRDCSGVLSASVRIAPNADFIVTGSAGVRNRMRDEQLFAGVTMSLGPRGYASASQTQGAGVDTRAVELTRSLPRDEGYGYRVRWLDGQQRLSSGLGQYQGRFGRYEAGFDASGTRRSPNFSVAGGLALIGGALFPTRSMHDSFALVRVPGAQRVRVYSNNQEVGRTNVNGDLLVPNLLPYYGNTVSISDEDVPLDWNLGRTVATIAPPRRGAATVMFTAQPMHNAMGRLVVNGQTSPPLVPRFGQLELTVAGVTMESPIGRDGEFYLENVSSGPHVASLHYDGIRYACVINMPQTTEPVTDLGLVRCSVPLGPVR